MNNNLSAIRAMAERISKQCEDALGRIPEDLSFERFIHAATNVGRFDNYKHFTSPSKELMDRVAQAFGAERARIYLRGVLSTAVRKLVASDELRRLPPRVQRHQLMHLERIARDDDSQAEWLDLKHDLFHKEFGLATLRLYAAGAQLVDYRCGIPRSVVTKEGLFNMPPRLMRIMRVGGFKPYFEIHTHKFNLDNFHEEGWNECYRCCAELYDLHPDVLGMFGSSWFYDPALDTVSPRLSYLRKVPAEAGASIMFVEVSEAHARNALATSPSRRKLHEEGRYQPKAFMLLWGKKDQVLWASRFRED